MAATCTAHCGLCHSLNKVGRENWVHDNEVTQCSMCQTEFSALVRKHHCRACGNIYCAKCSSKEIEYTPDARRNEDGYTQKKKRVCDQCYESISLAQKRAAEANSKMIAREPSVDTASTRT